MSFIDFLAQGLTISPMRTFPFMMLENETWVPGVFIVTGMGIILTMDIDREYMFVHWHFWVHLCAFISVSIYFKLTLGSY
jgi:hypothetical protein